MGRYVGALALMYVLSVKIEVKLAAAKAEAHNSMSGKQRL
jgi:hypothetical protein